MCSYFYLAVSESEEVMLESSEINDCDTENKDHGKIYKKYSFFDLSDEVCYHR